MSQETADLAEVIKLYVDIFEKKKRAACVSKFRKKWKLYYDRSKERFNSGGDSFNNIVDLINISFEDVKDELERLIRLEETEGIDEIRRAESLGASLGELMGAVEFGIVGKGTDTNYLPKKGNLSVQKSVLGNCSEIAECLKQLGSGVSVVHMTRWIERLADSPEGLRMAGTQREFVATIAAFFSR